MHNGKVAQVSLKSSRVWVRYEKNNYTQLIKPQTAIHARVCEENKKELEEKNDCPSKYFEVKGLNLEGCRTTLTIRILAIFITWIVYTIKVIVL